jgi:hypothetical protein
MSLEASRFRVWGLGFRVWGLGFRVHLAGLKDAPLKGV